MKIQVIAKASTLCVWLRCYESPLISSHSLQPQWYVGRSHQTWTYSLALTSKVRRWQSAGLKEHLEMTIFMLQTLFRTLSLNDPISQAMAMSSFKGIICFMCFKLSFYYFKTVFILQRAVWRCVTYVQHLCYIRFTQLQDVYRINSRTGWREGNMLHFLQYFFSQLFSQLHMKFWQPIIL